MKTTIFVLLCGAFCESWCAAQAPAANAVTGVIAGAVTGTGGSTVTVGLVSALGVPSSVNSRLARTSVTASINSDGTFALPALAAGTYRVCVQTQSGAWLDPCQWGSSESTVSLSLAQPSANLSIVLNQGALVGIQVNDPSQLLSANEGITPGAHLLLGVGTDAIYFRNASLVSQNASGRNYQVLIPFDRTISVSVASGFFKLADANGRALTTSGNLFPVLVPSGQQSPKLVFTVTGLVRN